MTTLFVAIKGDKIENTNTSGSTSLDVFRQENQHCQTVVIEVHPPMSFADFTDKKAPTVNFAPAPAGIAPRS